jgi:hypothetical protein
MLNELQPIEFRYVPKMCGPQGANPALSECGSASEELAQSVMGELRR